MRTAQRKRHEGQWDDDSLHNEWPPLIALTCFLTCFWESEIREQSTSEASRNIVIHVATRTTSNSNEAPRSATGATCHLWCQVADSRETGMPAWFLRSWCCLASSDISMQITYWLHDFKNTMESLTQTVTSLRGCILRPNQTHQMKSCLHLTSIRFPYPKRLHLQLTVTPRDSCRRRTASCTAQTTDSSPRMAASTTAAGKGSPAVSSAVIVGGGIGGLILAIALRKIGVDAQVTGRMLMHWQLPDFIRFNRSICMWERVWRI